MKKLKISQSVRFHFLSFSIHVIDVLFQIANFVLLLKINTIKCMVCLLSFHRDLKPTNVLLDEDDRPVLMDLGSMNRARVEVRMCEKCVHFY